MLNKWNEQNKLMNKQSVKNLKKNSKICIQNIKFNYNPMNSNYSNNNNRQINNLR